MMLQPLSRAADQVPRAPAPAAPAGPRQGRPPAPTPRPHAAAPRPAPSGGRLRPWAPRPDAAVPTRPTVACRAAAAAAPADGDAAAQRRALAALVADGHYASEGRCGPDEGRIAELVAALAAHGPVRHDDAALPQLGGLWRLQHNNLPHPLYNDLAKMAFGTLPQLQGAVATDIYQWLAPAAGHYAGIACTELATAAGPLPVRLILAGSLRVDPAAPTDLQVELDHVALRPAGTGEAAHAAFCAALGCPAPVLRHSLAARPDGRPRSTLQNDWLDGELRITRGMGGRFFVFGRSAEALPSA